MVPATRTRAESADPHPAPRKLGRGGQVGGSDKKNNLDRIGGVGPANSRARGGGCGRAPLAAPDLLNPDRAPHFFSRDGPPRAPMFLPTPRPRRPGPSHGPGRPARRHGHRAHGGPWGTSVAADSRSVDAPEPRPAARPSTERAAPRPGRAASGPGPASWSPAKPKGPALRACLPPVVLGDHLVRLSPSARPRAGPRAPGSPAPGRCHAPPATARTVPAPAGATGPPAAAPPRRRPPSTTAPVRVA